MEGENVVTRHKESLSSSSIESTGDDIVLEKPLKNKASVPSSPTKEPQSFSFISSTGDQSPLPPGYDPNRIPSSIFASKPANGAEWSVASNESLFSIQMGNSSFTRDHAFMLYKSGELAKAEELYGSVNGNLLSPVQETEIVAPAANEEVKASENEAPAPLVIESSPPAPLVIESPPVIVDVEEETEEEKTLAPAVQPSNSSTSICVSPHSPRSDGSNHSTRSFAFPVLAPNASSKEDVKKHEMPKQSPEHRAKEEATKEVEAMPPVQALQPKRRWFNCFYCCPSRCN